jgi:hypothetical protein
MAGDAAGFAFQTEDGIGMGGRAPLAGGKALRVRTPAAASIRLLRNGRQAAAAQGTEAVFHAGEEGVYRIEATLGGRPWIFSNPISLMNDEPAQEADSSS